jgi:enoyl-CoA hydratase/carnithine racemase
MKVDDLKDFQAIQVSIDGPIVTLRLNRPTVSNAINWMMQSEIYRVLDACESDDAIKCLLITANGKNFSAGHDIAQVAEEKVTGSKPATFAGKYWARTGEMLPMWYFRKAMVVAVKGFIGPHANALLLTADAVVAADNSVFSFEETRVGIGAPYGPYALMPFHFPLRVVKQLWMSGGWMDAETARKLFYVNSVVPLGEEDAEARRVAEMYACMDLANLMANKEGIHELYRAAGLPAMIDIGREPYEPKGAAAAAQAEHFRLIYEKGAGEAARSRDAVFDRRLSRV